MGTPAKLTESAIRAIASPESFQRGQTYYRNGSVVERALRGSWLQAEVQGSDYDPYEVSVNLEDLADATCTCPYEWGGACKHIVAALLAHLNDPEETDVRAPLDALLAPLDRDQLLALLIGLAGSSADLADRIESRLPEIVLAGQRGSGRAAVPPLAPRQPAVAGPPSEPGEPPALPPVDAARIRKRLRSAFRDALRSRDYDGYWDEDEILPGEAYEIMREAEPYIEAGDGRSALSLLAAVTESYTGDFLEKSEYGGESPDFLEDLGGLWAEALLTADLSLKERGEWEKRIRRWKQSLANWEQDYYLEPARLAVEQGWDHPPLLRVLAGEISAGGPREAETAEGDDGDGEAAGRVGWEDGPSAPARMLTRARLNILERQGRLEEYLRLARAAGQTESYMTMLVQLGRIEDAVEFGLHHLTSHRLSLVLAKALHSAGAVEEAFLIAERGLELKGDRYGGRYDLAAWLRDAAKAAGRSDLALSAALAAARDRINLDDYLAVKDLAGDGWPALHGELIDVARRNPTGAAADIFIHEGLIDDAIAVADRASAYDVGTVEKVVDAALGSRPDWVSQTCARQFSAIADAGASQHYDDAVRWLRRSRDALRAAGREEEFQAYLDGLLARHARKYKLVPMLKQLQR